MPSAALEENPRGSTTNIHPVSVYGTPCDAPLKPVRAMRFLDVPLHRLWELESDQNGACATREKHTEAPPPLCRRQLENYPKRRSWRREPNRRSTKRHFPHPDL
jgi:hypothetical protein